MPIENASVDSPEHLSPYVRVARLRLPAQRFDSDWQLAFADSYATTLAPPPRAQAAG